MYHYSCKNCNIIVRKFNNTNKWYDFDLHFCNYIRSKKSKSIYFLDCMNCNKFIGIYCCNICINCFGNYPIIGEKNLLNWFSKYKKNIPNYPNCCKNCNEYDFRRQYWFFEELIFL